MSRPVEDLVQIAAAGAGFTLRAVPYNTEELVRIVATARDHGCRIQLTDVSARDTQELVKIAATSKGCVTFDL